MAEKQLIVAVERTVAMGPHWENILMDYLQKMIRSFGGNESTGQRPYTSTVEFALVTFCNHGCHSGCLVQRTGWTRDPDAFFRWLSAIPFSGDGFNDAAVAEGLSEALMMFCNSQSGGQNQQNVDLQKHCILVAASNPYPLPTPVYVPRPQNLAQSETSEADLGNRLYDAEAVAKAFPELSVSLSVICPKQLTKVRAIYNLAQHNRRSSDPPIDTQNTHFLILISESFREASSALSRSGITSLQTNESPVKVESVSVPPINGATPTSMPSVNGSITNWQPISTVNVALATVKLEPGLVTSTVSAPAYPQISSVPCAATQAVPSLQISSPSSAYQDVMIKNENAQDLKPIVTMPPPLCTVGPARANVGQKSSIGSLTLATSDVNDAGAAPNMSLSQQTSGATQSTRSKYARVWEGNLYGQRHGQPKHITRLECYRKASASETLSANWPSTMHIDRLISQDHMNNKRFRVSADFLVFRAMSVHGFLGQLHERKLCAVIRLPSWTLLLSVPDKVGRLIGMLLPANMCVFKPRLSTQQQQQHQQMQSQQQQHLLQLQQQQWQLAQLQLQEPPQFQQQPLSQLQLQHQQQFPQQQQMVGAGMGQGYVQGPGWSQLVFQGQFSSQGNPNTGGGGFMG